MGKKGHNKPSAKKELTNEVHGKSLSVRKRNEVTQLADRLLRISTVHPPVNATKAYELHVEIDEIVNKIIHLEASIDNSAGNRNSGAIIKRFTKWVDENGAKFESLSIEEFPGYELGLKTSKDIKEGSLVIAVPRKLMMTMEAAKKSVIGPLIEKDKMLNNMPNVAMAMFLLTEKFSPNSFWKPYIDILPIKYTTVLFFTKEELFELRESPTFGPALNLVKSIVRQYAYFSKLIQTSDDPAAELLKNVFTYEQYRWAVSTVMTRQNSVPSEDGCNMINALIPLWDMCNHTNGSISTDYNPELQRSECLAVQNFKAGDQLFIFYGNRPNADLFLHNGFVYEDNIHDGYWLKLGISKSDPLYEKRLSVLSKIRIPNQGEFLLRPGSEPIDVQLLAFLRIFNMNEAQLDQWLHNEKATDEAIAIQSDLENKTWTFLQTRLRLILGTYNTTLSEDLVLLADSSVSSCRKLAIQMRVTEKRILQGALNYVEQHIKK